MSSKMRSLILGAFCASALAQGLFAQTLSVTVRNPLGTLIQGATVYAVRFGSNGPDASVSTFAVTAANGQASLGLSAGPYEVVAEKHGFFPSSRDQYFNPEHIHLEVGAGNPPAQTITISSVNAPAVGTIIGAVTGATANRLLFGHVKNRNLTHPINFGMCRTDGSGACNLAVANIPAASSGTYEIGAFDPLASRGVNLVVNSALAANASVTVALSFTQNALPNQTVESQTRQQDSGQAASRSVDGVVVDTTTAENSIPFVHVEMEYTTQGCSSCIIRTNADSSGRFQFFNLTSGVTYYARIFGNCNQSGCFDGHVSSKAFYGAPPGINDFLYTGTPIIHKIRLNRLPAGSGSMAVYVKNQAGQPVPRVYVNVYPDWDRWEEDGDGVCNNSIQRQRPGMANANKEATTGYVLITDLVSGNYTVRGWTQLSNQGFQYNAGPDGQFQWGSNHCGTDDLRVSVDTAAAQQVKVFDGRGVNLNVSSITIIVNTLVNTSGRVQGTLNFPRVVDLRDDPITIVLQGACQSGGGCQPGNFAVVNSSGASSYTYNLFVASGTSYRMRVESGFWGLTGRGGELEANLRITSHVVLNMNFAPAGKLMGKLYKPDGTLFQPSYTGNFVGASVNVRGKNVECWRWGQVTESGEFTLGGLLPGTYEMVARGWGNFTYVTARPLPEVTMTENQTINQDINLVPGVGVIPQIATNALPGFAIVMASNTPFPEPLDTWVAQPTPPGTVLKTENLQELFLNVRHGGPEDSDRFTYYPPTNTPNGPCWQGAWPGGFCAKRVPAPTANDFYLGRAGDFRPGDPNSPRPFFTVFNTTKNVLINSGLATTNVQLFGTTVPAVSVNLTPNPSLAGQGQATLSGNGTAVNIFRQSDFEALGGKFDKFLEFIPVIALYDASGTFKAVGMFTPSPTGMTRALQDQLDRAIAENNWTLFKQTLDSLAPFGYEIRGLKPSQTFLAVVTTPNYPPYQTKVTLGADGSTTTLNIDLDQAVGSGATLSGVVTSTNGALIANASVVVESEGYPKKRFTTNALGAYSVAGLPAGTYRILVSAGGYIPAAARKDISGTSAFTQNFSLTAAGPAAIITGTVYSQKIPFAKVLPNAAILAYDDTFNGQNPTSELPLYKVKSSSMGVYRLDNLIAGNTYKLFLKVPGSFILIQTTVAPASNVDFTVLPKPLRVEVSCVPRSPKIECTVQNPSDFSDGNAWYHDSSVAFSIAIASPVTDVQQITESDGRKKLILGILQSALSDTVIYTLRIQATSLSGKEVIQNVTFSKLQGGGAKRDMDEKIIGDSESDDKGRRNNDVSMDETGGNASSLRIPTGSMLSVSSGSIPDCSFNNFDVNAPTVAAIVNRAGVNAFVGGVYQVQTTSVNFTSRGFELCLAYDKNQSNLADIALHHYNTSTGKWEIITGQQTIDPVKGTVCARIYGISTVTSGAASASRMHAQFNGQSHSINPLSHVAGHVDEGSFGILRPSVVGNTYSGDSFKVFNFPNPFNLQNKTKTIVHGGATTSITTLGTIIKYEVPSSAGSGRVYIRIYNLAGELVRELDEGEQSGGRYYYTTWNGKNKDGQDVANGVYYGIVSMPGVKAKDATFKMAVIK